MNDVFFVVQDHKSVIIKAQRKGGIRRTREKCAAALASRGERSEPSNMVRKNILQLLQVTSNISRHLIIGVSPHATGPLLSEFPWPGSGGSPRGSAASAQGI